MLELLAATATPFRVMHDVFPLAGDARVYIYIYMYNLYIYKI